MISRWRRQIRQGVAFLMLAVALAMVWNLTVNLHVHVLPNGAIVMHAHPLPDNASEGYPVHGHDAAEYSFLQTILELLPGSVNVSLAVDLACKACAYVVCPIQKAHILHVHTLVGRAPPASFYA